MRLRFVPVVLAAAALAVLTAQPASALARPQVFSVLSVTQSFHPIGGFNFSRAPQAGDRFAFAQSLYKWAGTKRGARVGHTRILCAFWSVSGGERGFSGTALCSGQFYLPAGSILVEGFVPVSSGPANFRIPVVGGTGTYANARGYAHIKDLPGSNGNKSNNELHLMP